MARIEDIERRLLNWARWRFGAGSGGLGYATVNLVGVGGRDNVREAIIPTVDCEAEETDQAVFALPGELRATLEVVYLQGGTMATKARRLCCSEPTIYSRIDRAHRCIQSWLAERDRARREQRSRTEALQRMARP